MERYHFRKEGLSGKKDQKDYQRKTDKGAKKGNRSRYRGEKQNRNTIFTESGEEAVDLSFHFCRRKRN